MDTPEGCNLEDIPDIEKIDTSPITIEEVKRGIIKLKNGNIPGIDKLKPELLKESLGTPIYELKKKFIRVLEKREVPSRCIHLSGSLF